MIKMLPMPGENYGHQSPSRLTVLAMIVWAAFLLSTIAVAGPAPAEKTSLRLFPVESYLQASPKTGGLRIPLFSLTTPDGTQPASNGPDDDSLSRAVAPWTGLGTNALKMFSGSRAVLHLSAVLATILIVETGLDTQVHNFFVRNPALDEFSRPGVSIGEFFPVYLGAGLLGAGLVSSSSQIVSAGSAVLQASLLALCYTTALKALTGRPGPEPVIYDDNDASQTFRFGFLRGGVYRGWPSGHLVANTAAVTSLLAFYHDSLWLKVAGGAYLGYLFLSVVSHHGSAMHWFSDTVAGVLMGCAIGTTVGSNFRERWDRGQPKAAGLMPNVLPHMMAVSFDIPF
jgi:hypothetical protein